MNVCFLLERGSPPRRNPTFARVFDLLGQRGVGVTLCYPEEELLRLDLLTVEADLYLLKSDTELALSLALALEVLGARVLNSSQASARAKDKALTAMLLHQAGCPTPRSFAAARPGQLAATVTATPLILKPHRGYHGAGIALADTPAALPANGSYPELIFAQHYLSTARNDLKVYVIGDRVFGVRKPFSPTSFGHGGEPVALSREVEALARRCGQLFGLELYGLDLAEDETGPWVLDVNYFPGYRGVPDAATLLTDYIIDVLRGNPA